MDRPSRWADMRDGFAAIREVMIVLAILALLLAPTKVRNVLENAGIRSVAGIEFDAQTLTDAQNQMAVAQAEVDGLRQTLAEAKTSIDQIAANNGRLTPETQFISRVINNAQLTSDSASEKMSHARRKFREAADGIKLQNPTQLFGERAATFSPQPEIR